VGEKGMGRCFVIQPFDGNVFDKRYQDVFEPAIIEAGLEPYRVDKDPGVSVPIDDIEAGIRDSELCFAEITTDNPNVWFELGYAIGRSKDVVLICSEERTSRFPFDVQHRSIIKYQTGAPQDFIALQNKITDRIRAIIKKQAGIERVSALTPVKDTEGLSPHEVVALVTIAENEFITDAVTAHKIQQDMNNAGFTDIAVSLALKSLGRKGMVMAVELDGEFNRTYTGFSLTSRGDNWLIENEHRLTLRAGPSDDEIPY
jgi:hypothetical protein